MNTVKKTIIFGTLTALGALLIIYYRGIFENFIIRLWNAINPVLIGFFIAYMINPMVKLFSDKFFKEICGMKNRKTRRALSVFLSYIIIIGVISAIITFVIPQLIKSFSSMSEIVNTAQNGYKVLMNFLENLSNKYPQLKLEAVEKFIQQIPEMVAGMFNEERVTKMITTVFSTSISFINGFFNALIAIMVSIYMLLDKNRLINGGKKIVYAILKNEKAEALIKNAGECNEIFSSFIVGKFIDSLIIGMLCFILMTILNLPCTLLISVVVGITNMIPYFGPFIGAIPSILLLLFIDFTDAFIFAVLILALQQFDGLYLGPRILGDKTGLRPLWVIFAITAGGYVAGPAGMFLGVPTVAVIAHLGGKIMAKRMRDKEIIFYKDVETGIIYTAEEAEDMPGKYIIYEGEDNNKKDDKAGNPAKKNNNKSKKKSKIKKERRI